MTSNCIAVKIHCQARFRAWQNSKGRRGPSLLLPTTSTAHDSDIHMQLRIRDDYRASLITPLVITKLLPDKIFYLNPLSANLIKWLNTLKKFVSFCQRIFWLCLWGWGLKGSVIVIWLILDLRYKFCCSDLTWESDGSEHKSHFIPNISLKYVNSFERYEEFCLQF